MDMDLWLNGTKKIYSCKEYHVDTLFSAGQNGYQIEKGLTGL